MVLSRSRGYLPHRLLHDATYFLTFRLSDSLPSAVLQQWFHELQIAKKHHSNEIEKLKLLEDGYAQRIERYLDSNEGHCWLKDPKIADMVVQALRYFDGSRYVLHAWTIMPNHVHVLFTLSDYSKLAGIVQSWKGFTAKKANEMLSRSGSFWQPEYFDRIIRTERQFRFTVRYILNNPVKAGLCNEVWQWRWSGCSDELLPKVKVEYGFL